MMIEDNFSDHDHGESGNFSEQNELKDDIIEPAQPKASVRKNPTFNNVSN